MLMKDTSLIGWGAILDGHPSQEIWSACHLDWHINCLKLKAVFWTLKYLLRQLRGYHALVRVENTVVTYINHRWTACSCPSGQFTFLEA